MTKTGMIKHHYWAKRPLIALILPILILLSAPPALAQADLTITPKSMTVAGTRGSSTSRSLLLRTTNAVKDLQIISLDLNTQDGQEIFPAKLIQPTLPVEEIEANSLLSLPIQFQLDDAPKSGEFSGEFLIKFSENELSVPLTVRIKDPFPIPLGVISIGVILSIAVSSYRNRGKLRDKILVRVGQLRTQLRSDPQLAETSLVDQFNSIPNPFKTRIEAHLLDVEMALQGERWNDGNQAITQAESVWLKWRKGREDWLALLNYSQTLEEKIPTTPDLDPPYLQSVRRNLQLAIREAPDQNPQDLYEQLDDCAKQINKYLQLDAKLRDLDNLLVETTISTQELQSWQRQQKNLRSKLNNLEPTDKKAAQELNGQIEKAITLLVKQIPPNSTKLGFLITQPELLQRAPGIETPRIVIQEPRLAKIRLWIFSAISYAIAIVLLAGSGFIELYTYKSTFGANLWGDYGVLLAWGFGAEASRDAITKVVANLDLPGLK
ncbi:MULTISPECIES: hypothetical protein [unclassified Moorena]|uniref:hypothetical protein n=1 Tax=unclassified Moorena TaxID=2683338 RepID=UPI0014016345|nr:MULTISPECIES: hypothetical protein [unclassified Moorena]NEO11899.1 hypothetical protein [Moorena sp. SIO3E8]NEP98716.1 hypothetical protein [Moorena sp. SIO3F7]